MMRPALGGAFLMACGESSQDATLARLASRVDSLAVAVTAMKAIIENGSAARQAAETLTVDAVGAAALGSDSARVTIVEFTDYECPFCARHARETLPKLKRDFVEPGMVRYVVRDLPLPMHPMAPRAAEAARCAGAQGSGKYWRFHDALFSSQASLADSSFPFIARRLGLDTLRFSRCLGSNVASAEVRNDAKEAEEVGLAETPSFVIGIASPDGRVTGQVLRGAQPYEQFKTAIHAALIPHNTP